MNAGLQKVVATVLSVASLGTGFTLANTVENPDVLSPASKRFVVSEKFDENGEWIDPQLRGTSEATDTQGQRDALSEEFRQRTNKEASAEITADEALQVALVHAGVAFEDLRELEVDLDSERGVLHYEIEFNSAGFEYEYDVDAITAAVLKHEKEAERDKTHVDLGATISANEALDIALAHANVAQADLKDLEIELDKDDGRLSFEIEFKVDRVEHEFDIDAKTGEIIKFEKDIRATATTVAPTTQAPTQATTAAPTTQATTQAPTQATTPAPTTTKAPARTVMSSDAALNVALSHVGVSRDSIWDLDLELDKDDGRLLYEIEFNAGSYEYEFDIDAYSGTIIEFEKDHDDDYRAPRPTQTQGRTRISSDEALNIALSHAGVSRSQIRDLDVELDKDDGVLKYEIEFEVGNYEYEYDINAYTKSIIEWEREYDD